MATVPVVLPGNALPRGSVIADDFVIVRLLGSGGMGAVYVAKQESTGKLRALKVMHPLFTADPTLQKRFVQEARIGAQIRSGHVVEVVAAGVDATTGLPYLVMELLDGSDLRAHLATHGALPLAEVQRIFSQLCHAMSAAHAAGIVHRDLKPENIFLARPNQAGAVDSVVKILDFGIAKVASEAPTSATASIGSPLWMAPEQTAPGPVTAAADVWALGLIAFELLAGQPFWRSASLPAATPMQVLREVVLEPIPAASERGGARIPPGFDAWFARCVTRDPKDRFPDAGETWRAMLEMLGLRGPSLRPSGRPISTGPEALAETEAYATPAEGAALRAAQTPLAGVAAVPGVLARSTPASVALVELPRRVLALGVGFALLVAGVASGMALAHRPVASSAVAPETDGFSDPVDGARIGAGGQSSPAIQLVRGHHVRLFTRIVKNSSNVADDVVRAATDWSAWGYLRCYERVFDGLSDLPSGTVTVAYDILDQLPQHAALEASTFASDDLNQCAVMVLRGHTMNAARSTGAGHVVYGFKFVVVD